MKKLFVICLMASFVFSNQAYAQKNSKFGHIDSQALFEIMPEKDSAEIALQDYANELEEILVEMNTDLQAQAQSIDANDKLPAGSPGKWSETKREVEMKKWQDLQQQIQQFQISAQQKLQKKESELLAPIHEKMQKAIKDVADESGLIYVFDVNLLLHYSKESLDIMPLVKKKLGIPEL